MTTPTRLEINARSTPIAVFVHGALSVANRTLPFFVLVIGDKAEGVAV